MNADEFANAARSVGTRFGRGFHGTDIAANKNGDIPVEEVFLTDENNVRGFHHCVGRFDSPDETARFYHPQRFHSVRNVPETPYKSN